MFQACAVVKVKTGGIFLRIRFVSAATVDAVQPWPHPEAVELLAARKFERQGQRPRPILWKRRCVRHRKGRFVQLSTAGLRQPHAEAAWSLERE